MQKIRSWRRRTNTWPTTLFVVQRGVIEREERYLEHKFGDQTRLV